LLSAARLHVQQSHLSEAVRCYQEVVQLQPDCFEAQAQLGALCRQAGQFQAAVGFLEAALRLQPRFANLNLMLGSVYKHLGRLEEAAACCRREADLAPDNADAPYNLGLVLQNLDRPAEAAVAYQRALELRPNYADALINLGCVRRELRQAAAALPLFETAVRLEPQRAEAHWELGVTLLALGRFERGWQEYEWRWRQPDFTGQLPRLSQPRWGGEDLNGRRILLYAEQGYGDAIQFVRYTTLVAARGGRVTVGCPAPLHKLFECVAGVEQLITQFNQLPAIEVQAPLMSLPGIFKTTLATVPAQVPYILVPAEPRADAPGPPGRLRIGLVWAGRPTHPNDHRRSIPFDAVARLLDEDSVWFSLQVGGAGPGLGPLVQAGKITDWGPQIGDFMDTARAIARLDLVIAVDTAMAHLAGAMGKPVWLLLPFEAEWRWLLERADSPWYPTMRLFRQKQPNDWREVIATVAAALTDFKPPGR
jgi:tetratricopeptide (TPR) repeat protein